MNHLLNVQNFVFWLDKHTGDEVVGYMAEPGCCPIANYLRYLGYDPLVGAETTTLLGLAGQQWDNPKWVERFIDHVDDTEDDQDTVTARRAIDCLELALAEVSELV